MILDAYALIAFLEDEPAASVVEALLQDRDITTWTTAVTVAEVIDRLSRTGRTSADEAAADVAQLGLFVSPVDAQLGVLAGSLRATGYHRTRSSLSLADCVVAAEALRARVPLATADPDLLDVVSSQGGSFVALPASDGSVHTPAVLHFGAPLA